MTQPRRRDVLVGAAALGVMAVLPRSLAMAAPVSLDLKPLLFDPARRLSLADAAARTLAG